jgi:DNA-binding protein YbaB
MDVEQHPWAAQLERLRTDSERRIEGYRRLREEIPAMATTIQSQDRTVTITVGPSGTVTGLRLTAQALRHGPDTLARLILATMSQAHAEAVDKLAERVREYTGHGPSIDVTALVNGEFPELGGR